MKAADVPETKILEVVAEAEFSIGQNRWAIHDALPEFPTKVVDAKLYAMVRKGALEGCTTRHNCRGDFRIPNA